MHVIPFSGSFCERGGFTPSLKKQLRTRTPYFKGQLNSASYYHDKGKTWELCHVTHLFRGEKLFDGLVPLLKEAFPQGTQIYSIPCSDGSEPLSILLTLMDRLSFSDTQKYLPIVARDIGAPLIKRAKEGWIQLQTTAQCLDTLHMDEIKSYKKHIKNIPFEHIFHEASQGPFENEEHQDVQIKWYRLDSRYHQPASIDYQVENLMETVEKLTPDKPKVVFIRNVWQMLEMNEPGSNQVLARKLTTKLAPGSLVILGDCELVEDQTPIPLLQEAGFSERHCLAPSSGKVIGGIFEKI